MTQTTPEPAQIQKNKALRSAQCFYAMCTYVFLAALDLLQAIFGFMSWDVARPHIAVGLGGALAFFLTVKSPLSERFSDPSLTLPQVLFGVAMSGWTYAVAGPARMGIMALLAVVLTFTMFSLRPGQSRALAAMAFISIGSAMAWAIRFDPERYHPISEGIGLAYLALVLSTLSNLSSRLASMRSRLKTQKAAISEALERIGELASRDELTGLVNRRRMGEILAAALSSQLPGERMALAMLDLDFFKNINDSYGHQVGDAALRAFARIGSSSLREGDAIARWGGEEFLLMMPGTTPSEASIVVESMRSKLSGALVEGLPPGLCVTFSAGISACGSAADMEAAIGQADGAMYRAKSEGRGRSLLA